MIESPVQFLDDTFLKRAHLIALEISHYGKVLSIRPDSGTVWGWDEKNFEQFNLETHLLAVNNLSMENFKKFLDGEFEMPTALCWQNLQGQISPAYPVTWRVSTESGTDKTALALISTLATAEQDSVYFELKTHNFQAIFIPGFLHNINGLMGTMIGRMELLFARHPEMKEADQLIPIGNRLRRLVENFRYKISHENYTEVSRINLSRFLREEVLFLNCDLFFKHRVSVIEDMEMGVPEFQARYATLSGIIGECYHFCRKMMNLQDEYILTVRSFFQETKIGFELDFIGKFIDDNFPGLSFPVRIEGNAETIRDISLPELDTAFLANCMEATNGELRISAEADNVKFRYDFPHQ